MKLTRRGSLAAILGGILGGPTVAKQAMETSRGTYPSPPPPTSAFKHKEYSSVDMLNKSYTENPLERAKRIREEKERLEEIIAGKYNKHQQGEIEAYNVVRADSNIDALKSVSNSYKCIMRTNSSVNNLKESWVLSAQRRLEHLLETGLFL